MMIRLSQDRKLGSIEGSWWDVLVDASFHVGEDVMSSDELGVVVRDFISGIVILRVCDGIVLRFFGGSHAVVIGVL